MRGEVSVRSEISLGHCKSMVTTLYQIASLVIRLVNQGTKAVLRRGAAYVACLPFADPFVVGRKLGLPLELIASTAMSNGTRLWSSRVSEE